MVSPPYRLSPRHLALTPHHHSQTISRDHWLGGDQENGPSRAPTRPHQTWGERRSSQAGQGRTVGNGCHAHTEGRQCMFGGYGLYPARERSATL
jgi:hypothetical protein